MHIVMWSGGKDSTYMVIKLLEKGSPLDEIIFCDTGWEFPEMYSYILTVEDYIKNTFGFTSITKLNWGRGREIWHKWADSEFKKGRYKGLKRGFPYSYGKSWCVRELKINPVKRYIKERYSNKSVIFYIGITYDEQKRIAKPLIKNTKNVYPLIEWQVLEKETNQYLKQIGLYNPLYDYFNRLGCFLCPRQTLKRLFILYKHFPNLWKELYQLGQKYKKGGYAVYKIKGYDVDELEALFARQLTFTF